MAVVDLLRLILAFLVVRLANADEETCRVDRKADLGLAEYKPGAQNLRTDYDVSSAEECFQRCCNYSDSANNRCNAASYYKVAEMYPVCVLLFCNPFASCVWKPSTNFIAARIQSHFAQAAVQSYDTVSQISMLNQSAVTSQGPVNPVTTQQQQQQQTNSENPLIQAWNVNNDNVPPWLATPGPDSAIQGTAVDKPAQPFNQPEQPSNQQDQPFNQQGQPVNQQDQPFNQQDQPVNQQDQPFNQQDQPVNQQDQPFNQQDQPFNQQDHPVTQQDQPFNQQDQPFNQPEQDVNQPFNINDALVPVDNADGWPEDKEETASSSSSAQNPNQTPTSEDEGPTRVRPFLNQSPGIIIGLCSALGVSFLVLIAICRKIYQAGDKPKYKPLRDYDIRFEPPVASSALLP